MTYNFQVDNGFMDIEVGVDRLAVAACLRRSIIRWMASEEASSMEKVFRSARMCWELYNGADGWLTDLDAEDVHVLYSMPLDETTEKLFQTMNLIAPAGATLTRSELTPKMIHAAAVGISRSMLG